MDTEPKLFSVFTLGSGFNPGPGYSLLCPTIGPGVQPRVKTSKSFSTDLMNMYQPKNEIKFKLSMIFITNTSLNFEIMEANCQSFAIEQVHIFL